MYSTSQTLGGGVSNWEFCTRMHFWGAMAIFHHGQHQFSIFLVNTWKIRDPNFRGVSNWKFCSRMHFWGAMTIFPIFYNDHQHQFSVFVDTWKTGGPNFTVVSNWKFCSRMCFWELWPFFPFFRWFKFTLKPPNRITHDKLWLAILHTSFWTFLVKFGHNGPWDIC